MKNRPVTVLGLCLSLVVASACAEPIEAPVGSDEGAITTVATDPAVDDTCVDPGPDAPTADDPSSAVSDPYALAPMSDPPKTCAPKCTSWVCAGTGGGPRGGCGGSAANADCTYTDANGTTYGSGSGFCSGTTSWSMTYDKSGKPTGVCTATCACRQKPKKK